MTKEQLIVLDRLATDAEHLSENLRAFIYESDESAALEIRGEGPVAEFIRQDLERRTEAAFARLRKSPLLLHGSGVAVTREPLAGALGRYAAPPDPPCPASPRWEVAVTREAPYGPPAPAWSPKRGEKGGGR